MLLNAIVILKLRMFGLAFHEPQILLTPALIDGLLIPWILLLGKKVLLRVFASPFTEKICLDYVGQ